MFCQAIGIDDLSSSTMQRIRILYVRYFFFSLFYNLVNFVMLLFIMDLLTILEEQIGIPSKLGKLLTRWVMEQYATVLYIHSL